MINFLGKLYAGMTNQINQMDWVRCLDFALSGQSLSGTAHQHLGGIVRRSIIRGVASLVELASHRPIEAVVCAAVITTMGSDVLRRWKLSHNKHGFRVSSQGNANQRSGLVPKQCTVS